MKEDLKRYNAGVNRPPKDNMWSAIPIALLCMIVNRSERKQGSGPEGNVVLQNTGDFCLFVCCLSISPPPKALTVLKSALSGLKSAYSD